MGLIFLNKCFFILIYNMFKMNNNNKKKYFTKNK